MHRPDGRESLVHKIARLCRLDRLLDADAVDLLHQHEGPSVEDRLLAGGQDRRHRESRLGQGAHDPGLAHDVGGAERAGAGGREAEDAADRPALKLRVDHVSEAGVAFRNRFDLDVTRPGPYPLQGGGELLGRGWGGGVSHLTYVYEHYLVCAGT